ncbi:hypothetical protein QCA50_000398 [Cerrena zonata]|uniref:Alpha/beta hydrolase fold-3 domain-containing protein n=1 Tax=Cerrena zonata TaxID=2478898 RepID=A0AAW0GZW5_9APHY
MPVTTTSAAIHITPVVLKTFYKHAKRKGQKLKDGDASEQATDDILFDESFHITKSFIELGTRNTIESLQHFTNTHVPAPYWAAVSPVCIPLSSCNKAADLLIQWFEPEELKHVVGGERWWQIRGLDGIDAEWITEREYLDNTKPSAGMKLSVTDQELLRMEHLDTVMLYVHGGGYSWGSVNTHRYQIIRYARKFKGRAFAVNYRKAPQYPWPCPIQDVLAAYFYLTSPPSDALHKPVPPSKIVFAGDSAGGGLCLSVLTVLRDMGYELPAGAVLISPWVDLTHSFPSVMKNTATDIIPPHGFIHKPSPTWPIECVPKEGRARVFPTQTNPPPKPGHADTLQPSSEKANEQLTERLVAGKQEGRLAHAQELQEEDVKDQANMLNGDQDVTAEDQISVDVSSSGVSNVSVDSKQGDKTPGFESIDLWEPKPPKVLMKNPNDQPLEIHSQIQLYATNEQLTHPLVSPILQASLGGLCPLYIIAGDGEVLRDEIIYLAHKAANPQKYPTRKGVSQGSQRQRENAEKFQTPTRVHLQVFDEMCHVLTVFIFTEGARYAYRSIAEFVKHVTHHSTEHLKQNPFPELHRPPSQITDPPGSDEECDHHSLNISKVIKAKRPKIRRPKPDHENSARSDIQLYRQNEEKAKDEVKNDDVQFMPEDTHHTSDDNQRVHDIPLVSMIRERVDIFGQVRVMEDEDEIPCLRIPIGELGLIKEEPVRRWLGGQEEWDKIYHHSAVKAERKREHYKKKAENLIQKARKNGLTLDQEVDNNTGSGSVSISATLSRTSVGEVESERRWGPFDLEGEKPPESAIAGRRDTREAVALIKKSIFHSAPVTHKTVPNIPTSVAIGAAFDSADHPFKPPKQSASEEQSYAHALHGLKIWQSLISYFMKKSSKKAELGKRQAIETLHTASDKVTGSPSRT